MPKLSLSKAEEPYNKAVRLVGESVNEAYHQNSLQDYSQTIRKDHYVYVLDSLIDVVDHFYTSIAEQSPETKRFFKKYIKDKAAADQLNEQLQDFVPHRYGDLAVYTTYLFNDHANRASIMPVVPGADEAYFAELKTVHEVFIVAESMRGQTPILELMTNGRAGMLWFLLKAVPEFRAAFPYLQYTPDKQSMHRCHNHSSLFDKVYAVENPIWKSILPGNGPGCKCRVVPLASAEEISPEEKYIADPNKPGWPLYDFNTIEDEALLFWNTEHSWSTNVMLYNKQFSKKSRAFL